MFSAYFAAATEFQSTLPVWGATRRLAALREHRGISIHAPRVGSDFRLVHAAVVPDISIHAPRVGSDYLDYAETIHPADFNPRSPCGERLIQFRLFRQPPRFQSTLPVWGATKKARDLINAQMISIHAPRVGSDCPLRIEEEDNGAISIHAPRVGSDRQP